MDQAFKNHIDQIAVSLGDQPRRRSHGYWLPFAWAVRALVERGYGATESAREVLKRAGEEVNDKNVACVRVVFYKVRKQVWPDNLAHLRRGAGGTHTEPTGGTHTEPKTEDFEV